MWNSKYGNEFLFCMCQRKTMFPARKAFHSLRASSRARGLGFWEGRGGEGEGGEVEKGQRRESFQRCLRNLNVSVKKSAENADWRRFDLVMTLSFFACVVTTTLI